MSWQAYADNVIALGASGAALYDLGITATYAASNFSAGADELRQIVGFFSNPSSAFQMGIRVNGVKYTAVAADDTAVCGKQGNNCVVFVKTNTLVLCGQYLESSGKPGIEARVLRSKMEVTADALRQHNY